MYRIILVLFLITPILSHAQTVLISSKIKNYLIYKTPYTLCIDGVLNEPAWQKADWTDDFTDIEGDIKPKPKFATRVKMLWDENYLYFAAYLEEPNIWATQTERESVIFYDNDFEIFIDPDGDTHNYMEYEINALGTEWDLFLCKPYRDKCNADNSWNFEGLQSGIKIYGTMNNPTDTDTCWTVEIAIPWQSMIQYSDTKNIPVDGEQWRINFSRVEWDYEIINGIYIRKRKSDGNLLPEHNWVWSPQGVIAMHRPETWGFVQFSDRLAGTQKVLFINKPEHEIKDILREVYYYQKAYYHKYGKFSGNLKDIQKDTCLIDFKNYSISIDAQKNMYKAYIQQNKNTYWYITDDGRVFKKIINKEVQ